MTRKDCISFLNGMALDLEEGCFDRNCVARHNRVGTNSGCRCTPHEVARELESLAKRLKVHPNTWDAPQSAAQA